MLAVIVILALFAALVPAVRALCGCEWKLASAHVGIYATGALVALAVTSLAGLPAWLVVVAVLACDPLARKLAPLPRPGVLGGRGASR